MLQVVANLLHQVDTSSNIVQLSVQTCNIYVMHDKLEDVVFINCSKRQSNFHDNSLPSRIYLLILLIDCHTFSWISVLRICRQPHLVFLSKSPFVWQFLNITKRSSITMSYFLWFIWGNRILMTSEVLNLQLPSKFDFLKNNREILPCQSKVTLQWKAASARGRSIL